MGHSPAQVEGVYGPVEHPHHGVPVDDTVGISTSDIVARIRALPD